MQSTSGGPPGALASPTRPATPFIFSSSFLSSFPSPPRSTPFLLLHFLFLLFLLLPLHPSGRGKPSGLLATPTRLATPSQFPRPTWVSPLGPLTTPLSYSPPPSLCFSSFPSSSFCSSYSTLTLSSFPSHQATPFSHIPYFPPLHGPSPFLPYLLHHLPLSLTIILETSVSFTSFLKSKKQREQWNVLAQCNCRIKDEDAAAAGKFISLWLWNNAQESWKRAMNCPR